MSAEGEADESWQVAGVGGEGEGRRASKGGKLEGGLSGGRQLRAEEEWVGTGAGKGGDRKAPMSFQAWVAGLRRWGRVGDRIRDLYFVSYLVHIFFVDGGT